MAAVAISVDRVKSEHERLRKVGATDFELLMCAINNYGVGDYRDFYFHLKKCDRNGVYAAQKRRRNILEKSRRDSDPAYRLMTTVRARMAGAMRSGRLGSRLGRLSYSASDLKIHLEALFKPGMSWDNYGLKGWHIDYIKPCSSFDLSDDSQFDECWALTNLQPLWASENLRKGSKYGAA